MSGVPMNMMEWQTQLREQKEQERRKKTESAQILRGYRGGVREEDMKLTALKQEERRKQEEAERILREYRETRFEEREKKQRKNHGDHPLPPLMIKQEDAIEFQSVAEKAAQFDCSPSNSKVSMSDSPKKPGGVHKSQSISGVDHDPDHKLFDITEFSSTAVLQTSIKQKKSLESNALFSEASAPENFASNGMVNEEKNEKLNHPLTESLQPNLVVESIKGDILPPAINQSTDVLRLDVNFSFGLITASALPVLTNYMKAVDKIVKTLVIKDPQLSQDVTFDSDFGSFVQDSKIDESFVDKEGRSNVRRIFVTATVSVFLLNGFSIDLAREAVILGLQNSIRSGRFLDVALISES